MHRWKNSPCSSHAVVPHPRQQLRFEGQPGVQVVIIVARHGQQRSTGSPQCAGAGEDVVGREGDVLGIRYAGHPLASPQQRRGSVIRIEPSGLAIARLRTSPNGAASSVSASGCNPSTAR